MKTYYLFRHGETYFSKNQIPYGTHIRTASILPEAKPIIQKIARYLQEEPIDAAFRSEFVRCEQTAKIIEEETNLVFVKNELLNEFTENDFESFHKRMEKLVTFLENLKETHIAICTHGAELAALRNMLINKTFDVHGLMYYPNTGVILKVEDGKVTEIDFN